MVFHCTYEEKRLSVSNCPDSLLSSKRSPGILLCRCLITTCLTEHIHQCTLYFRRVFVDRLVQLDTLFISCPLVYSKPKSRCVFIIMNQTFCDHFFNLSEYAVRKLIPMESLDSLLQWGRKSYGYLFRSSLVEPKSQSMLSVIVLSDTFCSHKISFRGCQLFIL